jgi:hypothetical protein
MSRRWLPTNPLLRLQEPNPLLRLQEPNPLLHLQGRFQIPDLLSVEVRLANVDKWNVQNSANMESSFMSTNKAKKNVGLALAGVALMLFQNPTTARPGDIFVGEQVSPPNDPELVLNTTPCGSTKSLVAFHQPYRVIRQDSGVCTNGQRRYTRLQIEQK